MKFLILNFEFWIRQRVCKLAALALLLLPIAPSLTPNASATLVYYRAVEWTGDNLNLAVTLTPWNTSFPGIYNTTNFLAGLDKVITPTNGYFQTNLLAGDYRMLIAGISRGIMLSVTNDPSGTVHSLTEFIQSGNVGTYTYTNNANYTVKATPSDTSPSTLSDKIQVAGTLTIYTNAAGYIMLSNSPVGSVTATNVSLRAGRGINVTTNSSSDWTVAGVTTNDIQTEIVKSNLTSDVNFRAGTNYISTNTPTLAQFQGATNYISTNTPPLGVFNAATNKIATNAPTLAQFQGATNNIVTNEAAIYAKNSSGTVSNLTLGATTTINGQIVIPIAASNTLASGANSLNIGTNTAVNFTGSSTATIAGIAGGVDGREVTLGFPSGTTIANQSGSEPTPGNRIITGSGVDISLTGSRSYVILKYVGTRWEVVAVWGTATSGSGSGSTTPPYIVFTTKTNLSVATGATAIFVDATSRLVLTNRNVGGGSAAASSSKSAMTETGAVVIAGQTIVMNFNRIERDYGGSWSFGMSDGWDVSGSPAITAWPLASVTSPGFSVGFLGGGATSASTNQYDATRYGSSQGLGNFVQTDKGGGYSAEWWKAGKLSDNSRIGIWMENARDQDSGDQGNIIFGVWDSDGEINGQDEAYVGFNNPRTAAAYDSWAYNATDATMIREFWWASTGAKPSPGSAANTMDREQIISQGGLYGFRMSENDDGSGRNISFSLDGANSVFSADGDSGTATMWFGNARISGSGNGFVANVTDGQFTVDSVSVYGVNDVRFLVGATNGQPVIFQNYKGNKTVFLNNSAGYVGPDASWEFRSQTNYVADLSTNGLQSFFGLASKGTNRYTLPSNAGYTNASLRSQRLFQFSGTSVTYSNALSRVSQSLGTFSAPFVILQPGESLKGTSCVVSNITDL